MSDSRTPPQQLTQQATPTVPPVVPNTFPTPAHPLPGKFPKWLACLFLVIILLAIGLGTYGVLSVKQDTLQKNHTKNKLIPTITQSADQTGNVKEYKNQELGFSITIPTTLYTYNEGWQASSSAKTLWSVDWGSSKKEAIKVLWTSTGAEQSKVLHDWGHYSFYVSIDQNAMLYPAYSKPIPLTIENLKSMFIVDSNEMKQVTFQGRPAIRYEHTFAILPLHEVGGSVEYYIIDDKNLVRLWGTTYNTKTKSFDELDKTLSTFTFLDQGND